MKTLYEVCKILVDTETGNIIIRGTDELELFVPFAPDDFPRITPEIIYNCLNLEYVEDKPDVLQTR